MHPEHYAFRTVYCNPFTGQHVVRIHDASEWGTLRRALPLESPKPRWVIEDQEGTTSKQMPDLT